MTRGYLYLLAAIGCELVSSSALKASLGFTRLAPSLLFLVATVAMFFLLSLSLRVLPLGFAYAVWCGLGIVGTALLSNLLFAERLHAGQIAAMALVIAGVAVLHFSRATPAVADDDQTAGASVEARL